MTDPAGDAPAPYPVAGGAAPRRGGRRAAARSWRGATAGTATSCTSSRPGSTWRGATSTSRRSRRSSLAWPTSSLPGNLVLLRHAPGAGDGHDHRAGRRDRPRDGRVDAGAGDGRGRASPAAASCSASATCSRRRCSTSWRGWRCSGSSPASCGRPTRGGGSRSAPWPGSRCSTRTCSCCSAWLSVLAGLRRSSGGGRCSSRRGWRGGAARRAAARGAQPALAGRPRLAAGRHGRGAVGAAGDREPDHAAPAHAPVRRAASSSGSSWPAPAGWPRAPEARPFRAAAVGVAGVPRRHLPDAAAGRTTRSRSPIVVLLAGVASLDEPAAARPRPHLRDRQRARQHPARAAAAAGVERQGERDRERGGRRDRRLARAGRPGGRRRRRPARRRAVVGRAPHRAATARPAPRSLRPCARPAARLLRPQQLRRLPPAHRRRRHGRRRPLPTSRGCSSHFERCEEVDTVDNGQDIENEVQGTPIIVCRGLRRPWPETWDDLRHLS